MSSSDSTNIACECFVVNIIFDSHSTYGESLLKLSVFHELIELVLPMSVEASCRGQYLLKSHCEALETADD